MQKIWIVIVKTYQKPKNIPAEGHKLSKPTSKGAPKELAINAPEILEELTEGDDNVFHQSQEIVLN